MHLAVSAVIPLYNGEKFISACLRSVMEQTLRAAEVIVVDDGSTDRGPDLVREIAGDYPIRLLSKPNGGQSSARNWGVRHSQGTHIAFLDQDDLWSPTHLEELAKPFLSDADQTIGWTYGDLAEIDESGDVLSASVLQSLPGTHPKRDLYTCLRYDMYILPSASLIRRTAFEAVHGFDESLIGYEDDDLFLRLFRSGYRHEFVPSVVTKWRMQHPNRSTYSPNMRRSRMLYIKKLLQYFPDDPRQGRLIAQDCLVPRMFRVIWNDYLEIAVNGERGDRKEAFEALAFISRFMRMPQGIAMRLIMPPLRSRIVARLVLRILLYRSVFLGVCRSRLTFGN